MVVLCTSCNTLVAVAADEVTGGAARCDQCQQRISTDERDQSSEAFALTVREVPKSLTIRTNTDKRRALAPYRALHLAPSELGVHILWRQPDRGLVLADDSKVVMWLYAPMVLLYAMVGGWSLTALTIAATLLICAGKVARDRLQASGVTELRVDGGAVVVSHGLTRDDPEVRLPITEIIGVHSAAEDHEAWPSHAVYARTRSGQRVRLLGGLPRPRPARKIAQALAASLEVPLSPPRNTP
ncbi:MAG: hypothetical protein AAGC55_05145 [Myxococcota bacterium]